MDFIAAIVADADPPGVDRDRWNALIATDNRLTHPPPRMGLNPFTRAPMQFRGPPDSVNVVVAAKSVGFIAWCEHEANELSVYALTDDHEPLLTVARELADALDARVKMLDELRDT